MAKSESRGQNAEKGWEAPSGRLREQERARTLPGALRKLLGAGQTGSHARRLPKARIGTPLPGPNSRRVVVKVRVVQVGADWGKKAAKLHLAYIERDGVSRDGGEGKLYDATGRAERSEFERELEGEKHQFRIVLAPEDGHELDLEGYVRSYMRQLERDVRQKLRWAAVNHHDTDNPHAHVIIRGIDADGRDVRMDREYISHGLRNRAVELATYELGPRPERARIDQLRKEAELERYTSLDSALERRAVGGVFRAASGRSKDPHFATALRARLDVLENLGLVAKHGRGAWKVDPRLRSELDQMQRRAEGLRAIAAVVPISTNRCRVIQRSEPRDGPREELERGVQGVLRWKGLDEQGQFCVVIETTEGCAYHMPISGRVAQQARVGQVLDLKRAVDKDEQIERAAREQGWAYDPRTALEPARGAYRHRLEQLERMGLATRETEDRWRLRPDFRAELAKGKQQPYWQMLAVRLVPQPLREQISYEGNVWLDRVRREELGALGFGAEVRDALQRRRAQVRELGLDPEDPKLGWKLRELQRQRLEQSLAATGGARPSRLRDGFEGVARLHRASNGETFLEVRASSQFVLGPAPRQNQVVDGQVVRIRIEGQGKVGLEPVERDRDRDR